MAHRCQDEKRFKAIIEMLHATVRGDNLWKHPKLVERLGLKAGQSNYKSLFIEMSPLKKQALNRLIQLFKLKSNTAESYKSVAVFYALLQVFKHDTLDKREIIFAEILRNLKVNKHGDLCWVTSDFPLMVGVREFARINRCVECEPVAEGVEEEYVAQSQKMVISL